MNEEANNYKISTEEAIEELQDQKNGEIAEYGEENIGYTIEAYEMAIEALEGIKARETEVLRNIQQDCKKKLTCTGCRFQGRDEDGFTICKVHFPECWIIDEQEAAADE